MHRKGLHSSANRDFALGRHMDTEATSVVRKAGGAGDNAVTNDAPEAQRVRPMRAAILERDRGSLGRSEQDNACIEHASAQRFAADLLAGGHGVPTIARMDR